MLNSAPWVLSFFAGNISVLSPCVFPAIPFLVGSAFQEHKLGPVAISLGLITSFVLSTIVFVVLGSALGIEQSSAQKFGAFLLILMGVVYLIPGSQRLMERTFSKFANIGNNIINSSKASGLVGQFIVGLLIGAVWSPCIGPAYGSALALAATSGGRLSGIISIVTFGIGITTPILIIAYGLRKYTLKKEMISKVSYYMKYVFGVAMIGLGVAILFGLDKTFEEVAVNSMPTWLLKFITSI